MIPSDPTGSLDVPIPLIMMKAAYVFLDAHYVSLVSKEFGEGKYLNYDENQFAIKLCRNLDLWCKRLYYYTAPPFQGTPPTPKEAKLRTGYDSHIQKLKKQPEFFVREGRCQKIGRCFKQKGVDTLMIMDITELSIKKEVTTFVVVTSDTDFVPVLNKARSEGIRIILYHYRELKRGAKFSMSNHLWAACDEKIPLNKGHFNRNLES